MYSSIPVASVRKFAIELDNFEYQSPVLEKILTGQSISPSESDAITDINLISVAEWLRRYTEQKSSDLLHRTAVWHYHDQLTLEQVCVLVERGVLSLSYVLEEFWPYFYAQNREMGKRVSEVIDEWFIEEIATTFHAIISRPASENAAECERVLALFEAFDKEWGPLQDIKNPPSELPINGFPERIKTFIRETSSALEVSPDMVTGLALGALGAATSGTVRLKINNTHIVPLNPAILVLASSGEKKSGTNDIVMAPLKSEEAELRKADKFALRNRKISAEELKHEINGLERGGSGGSGGGKKATAAPPPGAAPGAPATAPPPDPSKTHSVAAAAAATAASSADLREKKLMLEVLESPALGYQTMLEDVTPEEYIHTLSLSWTCTGVIASDETNLFAQVSGLYGGQSKMTNVNMSISGSDILVKRRNGTSITLPFTHGHMVLMTQPEAFARYLKKTPDAMSTGLLARFNVVFPKAMIGRRQHKDVEVDASALAGWDAIIRALKRTSTEWIEADVKRQRFENAERAVPEDDAYVIPRQMVTPVEVRHAWQQWKRKTEKLFGPGQRYSPLTAWWSKAQTNALVFAALFTLADDPRAEEISAPYLNVGIELVEALAEHALYVMESGDELYANQVLQAIHKLMDEKGIAPGEEGLTTRMLQQKVQGLQWMKVESPKTRLKEVLDTLESLGYVKSYEKRGGGRGRPKVLVVLRPIELS
ncbi:hypothetical protein SEA_MAREELIH_189 [Gordonia phage Mareelih]|nr:hypothetical protein SEA_MAREELIH_189 [Gordonia phage Mareelih]